MQDYLITWQITIHAETAEEAARVGLSMQRDPDSLATCFEVEDSKGKKTVIDLLLADADEVIAPKEEG